ncbi:MAG: hypothetical protein Kow0042_21840 [Calditrichia bacterium]
MKKLIWILIIVFVNFGLATTYHTITIDGTNDFASDEAMNVVNGRTFYVTWDATYIYFGLDNANLNGFGDWFIWIDVDQTDESGATAGPFGVVTFDQSMNTIYEPEYMIFVEAGSYAEWRVFSSGSWSNNNPIAAGEWYGGWSDNPYSEIRFPWSTLGSPTGIAVASDFEFDDNTQLTEVFPPENLPLNYPDINWFYQFYQPHIPGPLPLSGYAPNTVDHSLPVTLISFTTQIGDRKVVLKWTTQSEVNNDGFEIYRANENESDYHLIASYKNNEKLKGKVNSNTRSDYSFTDENVVNGQTYWYKLADVSLNGDRTFHGPISATPNAVQLKVGDQIPESYALLPNYPNPFNPGTTIGFDIPHINSPTTRVNLSVYNLLGQKVITFFDGPLGSGSYQLDWNGVDEKGNRLPSGIYIAVLRTEHFTSSHKMILLR